MATGPSTETRRGRPGWEEQREARGGGQGSQRDHGRNVPPPQSRVLCAALRRGLCAGLRRRAASLGHARGLEHPHARRHMDLLRAPLSRRTFLSATAASAGAAALAGALPRTLLAQSPAAMAGLQVTSPSAHDREPGHRAGQGRRGLPAPRRLRVERRQRHLQAPRGLGGRPAGPLHPDRRLRPGVRGAGGPRLRAAPRRGEDQGGRRSGRLFLFDGGAEGQLPVLSTAPGYEDFTPLLHVIRVVVPRATPRCWTPPRTWTRRSRPAPRPSRRPGSWSTTRPSHGRAASCPWTARSPARSPAVRSCPRRTWTR